MTSDDLLADTVGRFFGETCTHEAIQQAEAEAGAAGLWAACADNGFTTISLPEAAGGSGGTIADALVVLRLAGYHAAPIPIAEHSMLGGWALTAAGLELPGLATVAPGNEDLHVAADRSVSGELKRVPWARHADRVVALVDRQVLSIPVAADGVSVRARTSLAGEPRDTVVLSDVKVESAPAPAAVTATTLRLRGALARATMMAGALDKMSRLTVSYTNEREQFGRPVARFQAVQQHLVWAAQDAALASMAADQARRALARSEASTDGAGGAGGAGGAALDGAALDGAAFDGAAFEIASAKLLANQAATRATRACHQAHGAMGMTQEYPLHHLSRRLWSWRSEYGGVAEWSRWVGQAAIARGADGLYPLITT